MEQHSFPTHAKAANPVAHAIPHKANIDVRLGNACNLSRLISLALERVLAETNDARARDCDPDAAYRD